MKYLLKKSAIAIAVVVGSMATAQALPAFSVDPTVLGGAANPASLDGFYVGTGLTGSASSFLQITSANTIAGHGWLRFSSLIDDTLSPVMLFASPNQSPAAADTMLWVEYSYTTKLTSGSIGALGSNYNITSLTMNLFGEKNDAGTASDSVFSLASAINPASASVAHSGDVVDLGSGSLISGVASFNTGGGSSFSPVIDLTLTSDGSAFFPLPNPFYQLAFTSATNTFQGFGVSTVNSAATISGPGDVNFNNVPEPGSLALLGLGLVGLTAARRRRAVK